MMTGARIEQQYYELTHGWNGFVLAYVLIALFSLAGLRRGKAGLAQYVGWPFTSLATLVVAGLAVEFMKWLIETLTGAPFGIYAVNLMAALVFMLAGVLGGLYWAARGRPVLAASHTRGAEVYDGSLVQQESQKRRAKALRGPAEQTPITLAGVALDSGDEATHTIILGTTGMGKSTLIREMVHAALTRGDRLIIADPDGGYLSRYYNAKRGDVILNPFDARGARWDLFAEITTNYDIDQLARSLIPDPAGSADPQWVRYARTFFESVTRQAKAVGVSDIGELYRLLTSASKEELRQLLAGTPAAPFLEDNSEKLFGGARSTLAEHVKAFDYLREQKGAGFSVRHWVRSAQTGVLFLPYRADQIPALRSVISTWMRLAMVQTMSLDEADYRLWFVIDELDALGAIDGLASSLPRLRKFGGRGVLGLQAISQVSNTYGGGNADAIVENCNNKMILRCSASEGGGTARFASRLIGEREIVRIDRSRSTSSGSFTSGGTESESFGERRTVEPAVLASEIEKLPRGTGYLKIGSRPDWLLVSFAEFEPAKIAKPFVSLS